MKKGINREPLNVTIEKEALKKFKEFCEKKLINRSKQVEELIKNFMDGKK